MIQWRVLNFSGVCPSGQQLRGSGPLAGCVVCRDGQHQPPRGAALRLHWCGHTHWHTTRCQTLLPVSHSLKICWSLIRLSSVPRHVYCVILKYNHLSLGSQMGHNYCCLLQQCLNRLQNLWWGLRECYGEKSTMNSVKIRHISIFLISLLLLTHHIYFRFLLINDPECNLILKKIFFFTSNCIDFPTGWWC